MYFRECELIAKDELDLFDAVRKVDRHLFEELDAHSFIDVDGIAARTGVQYTVVERIIDRLVATGLLLRARFLACPKCDSDIKPSHITSDTRDSGTCPSCHKSSRMPQYQERSRVRFAKRADESMSKYTGRLAGSAEVAVLTALNKEAVAVEVMLDCPVTHGVGNGVTSRLYTLGEISSKHGGRHSVVLVCLARMGNTAAAAATTDLLRDFPGVRVIVSVGIAGGVPKTSDIANHVRLGDVVAVSSEGVIQYDFGKLIDGRIESRSFPRAPFDPFVRAANALIRKQMTGDTDWTDAFAFGWNLQGSSRPADSSDLLRDHYGDEVPHPIDSSRKSATPKIHLGPIGSANIVLKDAKRRDEVASQHKVKAIEMEGAGVSEAAVQSAKDYFVVRAICDYCDSYKNDEWQEYASLVAAAFFRAMVRELPAGAGESQA